MTESLAEEDLPDHQARSSTGYHYAHENHITNCYIYLFLECSQGWRLHHFPEESVPTLNHLSSEEIFPNIQPEPSLVQLVSVPLYPITGCTR